jgi:hypothetical protein
VVEVIDADPEARQRTVKVKVTAEYQPVSELKTPKSRRTLPTVVHASGCVSLLLYILLY